MKLDAAIFKKHLLRNMPYCIIFIVILQVASRLPFALPLPDITDDRPIPRAFYRRFIRRETYRPSCRTPAWPLGIRRPRQDT